jgi:hypothetical protein
MRRFHAGWITTIVAMSVVILSVFAYGQTKLAEVPSNLPDTQRDELTKQRAALLADRSAITARMDILNKKRVPKNSPEYQKLLREAEQLNLEMQKHESESKKFNQAVEAAVAANLEKDIEKSYSAYLDTAFASRGSFMHDAFMSLGSFVHEKFQQFPRQAQSAIYHWAISKFNAGLQQEGLPPLNAEQVKGLTDSFDKLLAKPCTDLGITLCDNLQLGLKEGVSQQDAAALFEKVRQAQIIGDKDLYKPQEKIDFVLSIGAGAYTLNTNGRLGVKYPSSQFLDFVRKGQLKTLIEPLKTDLNKVTIDLSMSSTYWSTNVYGKLTFQNEAGRLICPFTVGASGSWKFGGSSSTPREKD